MKKKTIQYHKQLNDHGESNNENEDMASNSDLSDQLYYENVINDSIPLPTYFFDNTTSSKQGLLQTHLMDTNDVGNGDDSDEEGIIADMIQMTMMNVTQNVQNYRADEEDALGQNTSLLQSNDLL